MNCPDCGSTRATRLQRTMNLGDAMFRCKDCCRTFNERTGIPFNFTFGAHDIVFQMLLCRLRYKLSFHDVALTKKREGKIFVYKTDEI
ncbi:IS1 family transposase [Phormidium tenue FACHB-886]|nr:IS1 family transposase [Phormidium tenue FACHB-886]